MDEAGSWPRRIVMVLLLPVGVVIAVVLVLALAAALYARTLVITCWMLIRSLFGMRPKPDIAEPLPRPHFASTMPTQRATEGRS